MLQLVIIAALGYLLGSINISVLVTKYIGKIDIRTVGSGNAGGTNVIRSMGVFWGVTVIILEILKGVVIGLVAKYLFPIDPLGLGELGDEISGMTAAFGLLIGNVFPCFFGFKGGKGVTACGAAIVVLDYKIFIFLAAVFFVVFFLGRMVSLGSIVAAFTMPFVVSFVYFGRPYWYVVSAFCVVLAAILIIRHRSNIVRIINGNENKFNLWKHEKKDE